LAALFLPGAAACCPSAPACGAASSGGLRGIGGRRLASAAPLALFLWRAGGSLHAACLTGVAARAREGEGGTEAVR